MLNHGIVSCMDNEFGSALWDVKGIPNVGREYIKDVKPQGFTFTVRWQFQDISGTPQPQIFLTLAQSGTAFALPYPALLQSFNVAGWLEDGATEVLQVIDPARVYIELFPGIGAASRTSFQQDNLSAYGAFNPPGLGSGADYANVALNGSQGGLNIESLGFICRNLDGQLRLDYDINGVSDTYNVILNMRFKRA